MSIILTGCMATIAPAESTGEPTDAPSDVAEPTSAPARLYVEVFLVSENVTGKSAKIVGCLVSYDEIGIEVETKNGPRALKWDEITTMSSYIIKSRVIDKENATDWLELGRWCWQNRLKNQANTAFNKARHLDRELADEIKEIMRAEPATQQLSTDVRADVVPADNAAPKEIVKYQKATPEEIIDAVDRAEKLKEAAEELSGTTLVTLETPHFIIFTDWEDAEHEWMEKQCEMAYRVVSKQFRMSASDNVFVNKLPIVMFDKRSNFEMFASQHDDVPVGMAAGYYTGSTDGSGHMVMWRPDRRVEGDAGRIDAEKVWARILVHEFTHAYVARYKSNAHIPRWLNEGMADYIAQNTLPEGAYFAPAREAAQRGIDISDIFNDNVMPGWAYYPVMMSMVRMLVENDSKAFMAMFDDIKNGMKGEEALKKHFKIDYDQLQEHWARYARTVN
ncbi:MAG TPA: hypothetical protein PK402_10355 [Tepidisphaeraceae bacterium]|nr:hypothetical protein [Tepidisphaeraceae bacterium]